MCGHISRRQLNHTKLESIRAHLMVASIAATVIDAIVLLLIDLFNISESVFETAAFRLLVISGISIALVTTRGFLLVTYRSALRQSNVSTHSPHDGVHVSGACRLRPLVMLHLRLSGIPYAETNADRRLID